MTVSPTAVGHPLTNVLARAVPPSKEMINPGQATYCNRPPSLYSSRAQHHSAPLCASL